LSRIESASSEIEAAFEALFRHEKSVGSRKKAESLAKEGLDSFLRAAASARCEYRLGLLARARVAHRLQRSLVAKGYPPALVRQVLFAMLAESFTGK